MFLIAEIMNESKKMREGMASFIAGLAGKKLLVELRADKYANGQFIAFFLIFFAIFSVSVDWI